MQIITLSFSSSIPLQGKNLAKSIVKSMSHPVCFRLLYTCAFTRDYAYLRFASDNVINRFIF